MFGDVKNNDKNFFVKKGTDLFKFSSGKFLEATKRLESGIPVYGGNGWSFFGSLVAKGNKRHPKFVKIPLRGANR